MKLKILKIYKSTMFLIFEAQHAFFDDKSVIAEDLNHIQSEKRCYCFGLYKDKTGIITVHFTHRLDSIQIFGAGYWCKGKKTYEQTNSI